jgi:hypothetical protein
VPGNLERRGQRLRLYWEEEVGIDSMIENMAKAVYKRVSLHTLKTYKPGTSYSSRAPWKVPWKVERIEEERMNWEASVIDNLAEALDKFILSCQSVYQRARTF